MRVHQTTTEWPATQNVSLFVEKDIQPMKPNPFCLFTIGDPIVDIWSCGWEDEDGKWCSKFVEQRSGGALNTSYNVSSISSHWSHRNWSALPHTPRQLIRLEYPESQGGKIIKLWNYFGNHKNMYRFPGGTAIFSIQSLRYEPKGLVVSDYNKGTVNSPTKRDLPVFEFAVVDSKYRSLDMSWLRTSKVKIWHCTGSEYDDVWSENFNYTIHTDGANDVAIICNKTAQAVELSVPDTKVVDTIGAGDTFTAAVGVWLAHTKEFIPTDDITFDDVCDAARFAIWCCQDVITKKFTAICTRTLIQYLEETVVH